MRLRVLDVFRDRTGTGVIEFAIVLPVLLVLVLGLAQFGIIFYDYIIVANAAATGARQFSISATDKTAYTDTVNTIIASTSLTPALTTSNITLTVNGTACSTDASCNAALYAALIANTTPPEPTIVSISYPCSIQLMPTYLIDLTGICPLKSKMQLPVQ